MKTKLRILGTIILMLLMMGCKKEPYYNFRDKTKAYFVFFGKGSWWVYNIEGTSDTAKWEAFNIAKATFDYGDAKGDIFGWEINSKDIEDFNINLTSQANTKYDINDGTWGRILSHSDSVGGIEGTLTIIEDSIIVNGIKYDKVLHILSYRHPEVWLAPNVGIIKAKDNRSDKVYLLKSYKIEKL